MMQRNGLFSYMGHMLRALVKQKRIAEVMESARVGEFGKAAIAILDYKMKFEPLRFPKRSRGIYGTRGMSWHGSVVFHSRSLCYAVHEAESGPDSTTDTELLIFLDCPVVRNCTTQDTWAAAMIPNAVIALALNELPDAIEFWLVSDNARSYQNDLPPVIAPLIACAHGFFPHGFTHLETARGKSIVDAHFEISMRQFHRYVKEMEADVWNIMGAWKRSLPTSFQ